ncbi:hypothetical protein [Cupriavidus campinensis]|uniref:Cell division protein ZapA n=1 Tax=Cupriavidus campinensis TaxID=151783 RepID=A0ABY3ESX6_9BURK|nr:hypothetical protein [Cupriavidus campinensis]TSP13954.1 hypothetical protein FGG12_05640 [Cupriavidus campinensis]
MTKLLDLDALAPEKTRSVKIKGKEYNVRDQSVGDYIAVNKLARELKDVKETDRHVEAMIKMIHLLVEGVTEDVLKTLSFQQLDVLSQFVQGNDEPTPQPDQPAGEGAAGN